jgi:hypothetical protein
VVCHVFLYLSCDFNRLFRIVSLILCNKVDGLDSKGKIFDPEKGKSFGKDALGKDLNLGKDLGKDQSSPFHGAYGNASDAGKDMGRDMGKDMGFYGGRDSLYGGKDTKDSNGKDSIGKDGNIMYPGNIGKDSLVDNRGKKGSVNAEFVSAMSGIGNNGNSEHHRADSASLNHVFSRGETPSSIRNAPFIVGSPIKIVSKAAANSNVGVATGFHSHSKEGNLKPLIPEMIRNSN